MKRLPIVLSSLVVLAALVAVTQTGDAPAASAEPADGITVQGNASVDAAPDKAQLSFGVETQARTAQAALAQNAAAMRKVLAALRSAGATDLQTQYVSVSARHTEGRGIEGYAASNSVSATVKQLGRVGAVVDAAVAAGANQAWGPSFSRTDSSALYRQALAAAVADARLSAEALAKASGLTLGRVTAIVEGGGHAPMPFATAARAEDAGGSTPIEPGTQKVSATVAVTFAAG